jgi:hypothetical protein
MMKVGTECLDLKRRSRMKITTKLRKLSGGFYKYNCQGSVLLEEAATEIERLTKIIEGSYLSDRRNKTCLSMRHEL